MQFDYGRLDNIKKNYNQKVLFVLPGTKKKELFLKLKKNRQKMWPLSSRRRGSKALVAGPLK